MSRRGRPRKQRPEISLETKRKIYLDAMKELDLVDAQLQQLHDHKSEVFDHCRESGLDTLAMKALRRDLARSDRQRQAHELRGHNVELYRLWLDSDNAAASRAREGKSASAEPSCSGPTDAGAPESEANPTGAPEEHDEIPLGRSGTAREAPSAGLPVADDATADPSEAPSQGVDGSAGIGQEHSSPPPNEQNVAERLPPGPMTGGDSGSGDPARPTVPSVGAPDPRLTPPDFLDRRGESSLPERLGRSAA